MALNVFDLRICLDVLEKLRPSHEKIKVLALGYPDLLITRRHVASLMGEEVAQAVGTRPDTEAVAKAHNRPFLEEVLETASLFQLLGTEFLVADSIAWTGSEVVLDLNEPAPLSYHQQFHFIIDPGTLEHCFNVAQAIKNIASLLAKGGMVYHQNPLTHINHGFYNFSPTFYADFYDYNGFTITYFKKWNCTYDAEGLDPIPEDVSLRDQLAGQPIKDVTYNAVIARRDEVLDIGWPVQYIYGGNPKEQRRLKEAKQLSNVQITSASPETQLSALPNPFSSSPESSGLAENPTWQPNESSFLDIAKTAPQNPSQEGHKIKSSSAHRSLLKSLSNFAKLSLFSKLGFSLRRYDGVESSVQDVGRNYQDAPNVLPNFRLEPLLTDERSDCVTRFRVTAEKGSFELPIYYAHLALLKLCKDFNFETLLGIGTVQQNPYYIFHHLGKRVTTIEELPVHPATYQQNYLNVQFPKVFDAIWCAHVLQQQRNPGLFLNKIFDDLKEGGILAITVPYQVDSQLQFGHCNLYSPLILLYQLVCAGFDCSLASVKVYNRQISVLVKKVPNKLNRHSNLAHLLPLPDGSQDDNYYSSELFKYFPFEVTTVHCRKIIDSINWDNPALKEGMKND